MSHHTSPSPQENHRASRNQSCGEVRAEAVVPSALYLIWGPQILQSTGNPVQIEADQGTELPYNTIEQAGYRAKNPDTVENPAPKCLGWTFL